MLWPSTPAAPSLAHTFSQAASSVSGAYTLSIRLYQRPPLTPLTSADTMRSVQTVSSTHDQLRASAPCVALAGTANAFCDSFRSIPHLPSYPPSLGAALLSALFAAHHRCSTMRAVTPAVPRSTTGLSGPSACLLDIQSPTTSCARNVTCLSPRASDRSFRTRLRQA